MSTRRSARTTTQTPAPPATSTSSLSSRGTRSQAKDQSPASSAGSEAQPTEPRRSRRQNTEPEATKLSNDPNEEAIEDGDGEEVTRCICGHQEYPGPPLNEAFDGVDHSSEEIGGFFLACDQCSVWMHGGCVGIVEESQSPEKYYCEQCKPKLHDIRTDSRGQKYSLYLPLHSKSSRKGSVSKSKDEKSKSERPEPSRGSVDSTAGRRRNTLKSKQIYDEEEQLRLALEESKGDIDEGSTGTRKGKRSRDESEEIKQEHKRQRTASESHVAPSAPRTISQDADSDDDEQGTTTASRAKKARAEAAQTQRQVELREQEKERERARAEAAGRRQQRAGRRRGDESESIEDTPKPSEGKEPSPPLPSSQPPSPPTFVQPTQKKGPGKKAKRLGTNQYTKNRDISQPGITSSPHRRKGAGKENHGASSGDEPTANGDTHPTATSNSTNKNSPGSGNNEVATGKGKFGKGKGKAANGNGVKHPTAEEERTITNMKKTLDGMMGFITKTQLELAGEKTPPGANLTNGEDSRLAMMSGGAVQPPAADSPATPDRPFDELSSREMMDVMTRNIMQWQTRFAQYAG